MLNKIYNNNNNSNGNSNVLEEELPREDFPRAQSICLFCSKTFFGIFGDREEGFKGRM